jgi:Predicted integral membrane protein
MDDERPLGKRVTSFLKRRVVHIFIIGMLIRLILAPLLNMGYDVYHWALVISNFQSGNDLYGLAGYYYTPVWGYILGFASVIQDYLIQVPIFGDRFIEAFPLEGKGSVGVIATLTTPIFNFTVKLIMFIADFFVGYLIYHIIKELTKDEKKATLGFALWFLCPAVIAVSAICGMFDAYAAMFLLLSLILLYRSNYFLAGFMFSIAVMTKFFPIFFIVIMVAYVLMKHKEDGKGWKNVIIAAIGAVAAVLIMYIPLIMAGTVVDSFSFMTDRMGGGYGDKILYIIFLSIITLIAWKYYKKDDLSPETAIRYLLLTAIIPMFNPPTPQYTMILLSILVLYVVMVDRKMLIPWVVVSVFVTMNALTSNFTLLLSMGAYTDLISLDAVVDMVESYRSALIFGVHVESIVYFVSNKLSQISIWILFVYLMRDEIRELIRRIKNKEGHATNE